MALVRRLDHKVAVVSGAARGMGAAHARQLVDEGANVVIGDLIDDEGGALAEELGGAARFVHLDVTEPEQWHRVVATAVDEFGALDVLVNNAGINHLGLVGDHGLSAWRQVLDVNLTGTFLGIEAVAPTMTEQGRGSIVNISSIGGLRGSPGQHAYVASKFGVRGLTKSVAQEFAAHGIRVNSVHPGMIRTAMADGISDDLLPIPLRRAGRPEEVSSFVCFLASDESSYATGTEFVVDGGLVSGIPHRDA